MLCDVHGQEVRWWCLLPLALSVRARDTKRFNLTNVF